jgi:hypothetical protein
MVMRVIDGWEKGKTGLPLSSMAGYHHPGVCPE